MMKNDKFFKLFLKITQVNLLIGNSIFLIFKGMDANFELMFGMSLACTIYHFLFFRYSNFEKFSSLKLFLVTAFSGVLIIFLGIFLSSFSLSVTIIAGFLGAMKMFLIWFSMGILNFLMIKKYLKNTQNDENE